MHKILIILTLLILNSTFLYSKSYNPESFVLKNETSKSEDTENRVGGNFILDIIKDPNSDSELDSVIYVATGDGFSKGFNTFGDIEDIQWKNSIVGYGGSSAIAIDKYNNIWMTTATDSFVTDVDKFLATGTGIHMSADSGRTWDHFPQPGITAIQGLTYDIACDADGGIWLASFGQSIQKLDSIGADWRTIVCGESEWDPITYMNQRMFAVHHTNSGNMWVGTAEGVNLCENYSDPASLVWKQFTFRSGLTGNFVTSINSKTFSDGKEYVWMGSWLAEDNDEINGVSFTNDDGLSWKTCLLGEKIYNIGFACDDDVYACGESGLWKSSDIGNYWEKYNISVYSEIKNGYVNISKVYSFDYQNGKMFIGTGYGLVVSDDEGVTWNIIEAYEDSGDSPEKTYAYPNPFSPERFNEQKIQFKLTTPKTISCRIYNFAMEKVRDVVLSKGFNAGEHYISWDGKDNSGNEIANGVYFYIITYGDKKLWNKIIIFD